jgi:hypothetical protein
MRGFRVPGAWIDETHALDVSDVQLTPFATVTVDGIASVFSYRDYPMLESTFPGRVHAHRAPTDADYRRITKEFS